MKKQDLHEIIKKVIKEELPSVVGQEKSLQNDPRIQFEIDMSGKNDWIVKYNEQEVGTLNKINPMDDKNETDTQFRFAATHNSFGGMNNKTGNVKILKTNLIRWVEFRIEKRV